MNRVKREVVHDNFLFFSPTEDSQEKCWDAIKETLASKKKAALNVELDNNVNSSINPSTSNKKGLRSVKTGHTMAVIWTVSILLAFSFSLPTVMSILNLHRIRESSSTSLRKLSDTGLLWLSFGTSSDFFGQYFKSIGECFMMEFYEKVKNIFSMDLPSTMMHVAAKIPRLCTRFDSERVPVAFYNEHVSIPTAIEPNDAIEPDSYTPMIWASLFIVAALVFILLMLRALIRPKSVLSETYCSRTSKTKRNKPGGNIQITTWTKKQKSIARYLGEIIKTTIESTDSPRFGSFIEYVEIPVSIEGCRCKELKATPVRRSMRIRNKSLTPLQPAPTFTNPLR